jgi:polyhydroxyalkanoate synthesis regulator phasin
MVAGMAVAGAASSMMQAQQKNAQAKGMANNALSASAKRQGQLLERDEVMSGRIKKKSDQQRLQLARKTAQEAGSRVVAAAGQGTMSDTGSAARGIADTLFRGQMNQEQANDNFITNIADQRTMTQNAIDEDQARLENVLNQAEGMTQSPLMAGIMGGMGGASSGAGISTGLGLA